VSDTSPAVSDAQPLDESPAGLQKQWLLRITAAKRELEDFHREGEQAVDEFLGKTTRKNALNVYHSNVATEQATLSGIPKVRAKRRFADANDDVARVSATALERILNTDLERDSDGYRTALENAKSDWLKPGLGQVRQRYVVRSEPIVGADGAPVLVDGRPSERIAFEDVETDYVKWKRFLWEPGDVWEDVGWIAYGLDVSKEDWEKRWPGFDFRPKDRDQESKDAKGESAAEVFARAEVWEIWDKRTKQTLFLNEQQREILEAKPDPLELPGFFPSPRPLMKNATTSKCVPRSPYLVAKDLYEEAHELQRRIRNLVRFVRVVGAYDATNDGLEKILEDAWDGKLVPVKNWASLVDKGGLQGALAFLPNKDTIESITALSQRLLSVKQEIFEVTGQSDIMRGQSAERATATTDRIKARFVGTRIQAEQDELARFASEAQRIRAHIIASKFQAETIIQRSNIEQAETIEVPGAPAPPAAPGMPPGPPGPPRKVPNRPLIDAAIQMLKTSIAEYRIDVDADSLSMTDFDALQQEGVAIMSATADFFAKFAPLMQSGPAIASFVLELYQQFISGFRGAERFESLIDRGIAQLKSAASAPKPPPPPDPRLAQEQVKLQGTIAKTGAEVKKAQLGVVQAQLDAHASAQNFGQRMAEIEAERQSAIDVAPVNGDGGPPLA
jgi:hypothetical protein